MQIFIETERLIIRELLPTDDSAMFELDADPEVHRYLGNSPVKTIEESREIIAMVRQQYLDNGIGRWAMVEKASGNFMGWTGFKLIRDTINNHTDFYDLGYRIIRKYWGKGYATESAIACRDYWFKQFDQPTLYAMTNVENKNSKKVLGKVGFVCKETFTHHDLPHYWFELNRDTDQKALT
ncbi:GNAT family N-acetyltransferase [Mucilaginibacter corticis]|uniref:GNAT family N-acetyltransferase n=1 Tax=Mucilaginibacter corticis TaxID=2597670 RepID=A0A556MU22_9SPHI|nr:GNAT family N-acetyltransferase [Mucilaginibacter corticis]TSJ43387.1 GNAT family N-acetyltransferase [Mucilaginibacter corticis]